MTKIKGSTKMWSIILIPLLLYINYKAILAFIEVVATKDESNWGVPLTLFFLLEGALLLFTILPLIFGENGLLNKLNKWVDEKF